MYKLSTDTIFKLKEKLKRQSKTKDVNDDSFEKVPYDPLMEESVTSRVIHNHDITEARGLHASRQATRKISTTSITLQEATDVVEGYKREVQRMNSNIEIHLQTLLK